jgi:hypothetical protein
MSERAPGKTEMTVEEFRHLFGSARQAAADRLMQGGRRYVHLLPDDYDTRRFYTTLQLAPDGTAEQESYLVDTAHPDQAIVWRHYGEGEGHLIEVGRDLAALIIDTCENLLQTRRYED